MFLSCLDNKTGAVFLMKNLELNAVRLENGGQKNVQQIWHALASCGIGNLCYAYKSRVKPEKKLVEKVHRKIKENPQYSIEAITDVIGVRLITLFKNEIPKILNEVLLLIKHEKDLMPNPFIRGRLEEVIIFSNLPAYDPFLTELQSVAEQRGVTVRLNDSKEGYSSVHIVTRIDQSASLRRECGTEVQHPLPVEIQIRSVFEDAWGEIDHRFGYVVRAGKGDENLIYNSSLVQPHLKVLKQFTDACALYADTIYSAAHTPVSVKDSSGKIVSVPSDDEVLQRFDALGIPKILRDKYVEGRRRREAALALLPSNRLEGQAECLKAAAFFLSISLEATADLRETEGLSLYMFYAKMNEALCLLSTDSPQHVKSAELMYLQLREEYPDFILVQFRLAQALARLGQSDESIQLFVQTKKALDEAETKYKRSDRWPDKLPKTDYLHMTQVLPKLMGYQYWKKAQDVGDKQTKMALLLEAHNITKEAMAQGREEANVQNNLVYYAMEYLTLAEGEPDYVTKRLATSLHTNLAKMEETLRRAPLAVDVSTLDTMMEAYNFLGRIDLAQKVAAQIVAKVKNSDEGDPEETLSILKMALHIQSLQAASKPANSA